MTSQILVFGGWFGSRNIGDEAILIGIKNLFEKVSPDIELIAISTDPEYTKKVCNVNAVKPTKNIKNILNLYSSSDLIIISGGTPIYDYDYMFRFFYHFLLPKLTKKKVVYFGISSKRIHSPVGKILIKFILNRAEFITIREPKTEEILRNIGVKKRMILTGDSAFVIEPKTTPKIHVEKIIESPMIGICPRILSVNYKKHFHDKIDHKNIKNLSRMIAKTADYLIEMGCSVYFIPFHTEHYDDDMKAIRDIVNLMNTHEFMILNRNHDPLEVLKIIGEMDLIIGMRFHSLVFSAIQNIPMVTVNYDTKIGGLMELLGLKEFMCRPHDTPDTLISKIEKILDEKREIRNNLKLRVNNIRNSILMSAQEITNFI